MDRADGGALVEAIRTDYRRAPVSARELSLLDFAVKLTRTPSEVTSADIDALRRIGLDDAAIHDLVQVTALFNYFDRLADGLGIEPEPEFGKTDPRRGEGRRDAAADEQDEPGEEPGTRS